MLPSPLEEVTTAPIWKAVATGDITKLSMLLDAGISPDLRRPRVKSPSLFYLALCRDQTEVMELLFTRGANVDFVCENLPKWRRRRIPEALELVLACASSSLKAKGDRVYARAMNNIYLLRKLCTHGFRISSGMIYKGWPVLGWALHNADPLSQERARIIAYAGADIYAPLHDWPGCSSDKPPTVAHAATERPLVLAYLLTRNLDPQFKTPAGISLLAYVIKKNCYHPAEVLLHAGADPEPGVSLLRETVETFKPTQSLLAAFMLAGASPVLPPKRRNLSYYGRYWGYSEMASGVLWDKWDQAYEETKSMEKAFYSLGPSPQKLL